jgi:hypothetical protein
MTQALTKIDLPLVNAEVAAAKLANNNADIPPAVKSNGQLVNAYNAGTGALSIAAGATLTLPGGTPGNPKVYYLSSAKMGGNSSLVVTGNVIIFTDGNLDFTGGTVINNGGGGPPDKFMVYSSGGPETLVGVHGGAGFCGALYAPQAKVVLTGNGDIYGAAVGGKVNISGNGQFHYDEAMGDVGVIAFFEVAEWIEKKKPDNPAFQSAGL